MREHWNVLSRVSDGQENPLKRVDDHMRTHSIPLLAGLVGALFLFLLCPRSDAQITVNGVNWSGGCTYTPCTNKSVIAWAINYTWTLVVQYPPVPPNPAPTYVVTSATVNDLIDGNYGWAPQQFIGTSQSLTTGTIWTVLISPINLSFQYQNYLGQWVMANFQLPAQQWQHGMSSPTVVRGFGYPGQMLCNPNNILNWIFNYTNNTSSPLQLTFPDGQSPPLNLSPGAVISLTNPIQGDYQATVDISPLGQNGYLNSDFAYVTNGPFGAGWAYGGGDTNINYQTNLFNNGQDATVLALKTNLNAPIVWDNAADGPAQDSTLRAGFSAIANDLNEIMGKSNSVAAASGGGGSSNVWVQNWPSNFGTASFPTNISITGTNIVNFPTNTVDGSGSNYVSNTGGLITNYDSAMAKGTVAAQPLVNSLQGLSGMTPPDVTDSGDYSGQSIDVVTPNGTFSFAFDFVNDVHWSPVFALVKQLWVFILSGIFLWRMGVEIWSGMKEILGVQGVRINPLDVEAAGFGGNILGVTVSTVMVVVVLAAIAAFITAIVGGISILVAGGGGLSGIVMTMSSNPFSGASGGVSKGLAIVFLCFPVQLAVTYFVSLISFSYLKIITAVPICIALRIIPS